MTEPTPPPSSQAAPATGTVSSVPETGPAGEARRTGPPAEDGAAAPSTDETSARLDTPGLSASDVATDEAIDGGRAAALEPVSPSAGERPGATQGVVDVSGGASTTTTHAAAPAPAAVEDVVGTVPPAPSAASAPPRTSPASASGAPLDAPASPMALFTAFTRLSLQGFGGVLPVAQRELVERLRWLTREQFVEMLAVSQVLPGPNVVNLSLMFGDRHFGLRGAFAALAGMLLVPMVLVLVLAAAYARLADVPAVAGALRGMGAVAAGLVLSTGLKLLVTLRKSALGLATGLALAAAMALATGWLHWPLFGTLLGLGTVSCVLAWTRLGARRPAP